MEFAAMIVFGAALGSILLLFALRAIESRRGARFAETARASADAGALRLKGLLLAVYGILEKTPWFLGALARWSIHVGALSFARFAKKSAEYAHRLADFVSHKHRFERKETKSRYLKEVSGYKNGEAPVASE